MAGTRKKSPAVDYIAEDRGYTSPCWIWQRGMHPKGYGCGHERISDRPNQWRSTRAHRMYWEAVNGPVPDGMELDHLCRVRACVNPDHLEPVTHRVNVHRGRHLKLTPAQWAEIARSTEPTRTLSERYGVSYSRIERLRFGFKGARVRVAPVKVSPQDRAAIAQSTEHTNMLAARYGVSPEWIRVCRRGFTSPRTHVQRALTPDQVRAIRSQPHISGSEMARRFGVPPSTVSLVRAGKTYRDVLEAQP